MAPTHPYDGSRGLRGYTRMTDTDRVTVEVQEASDLEASPGPFCWLRMYDREWTAWVASMVASGSSTAVKQGMHASAHLDVEMARELRDALDAFLNDAAAREHR